MRTVTSCNESTCIETAAERVTFWPETDKKQIKATANWFEQNEPPERVAYRTGTRIEGGGK